MQLQTLSPKRLTAVAVIACSAALIPAAALAATASPAAPATAARGSASVTSIPAIRFDSATLVANGAAIQVVVTVTCGAGDTGTVNATTTQAIGLRVAQGGFRPASLVPASHSRNQASPQPTCTALRSASALPWSRPV